LRVVVGEAAAIGEERKVLDLRVGAFVNRADDIADDGAEHGTVPLNVFRMERTPMRRFSLPENSL